jgi:hypothetical protein
MSFFNTTAAVNLPCTTFVHRPAGLITGAREVFDEASRIAVTAFPMSMVRDIVASKAMMPACYLLSSHDKGYIGETGNIGRRLSDHSADPSKSFADEVFVITGGGNASFDKTAAVYLQHRLTRAAEEAGLIQVLKGASARVLDLPDWRRAPLDRIVDDTMRLLFDAGCRFFNTNCMNPPGASALPHEPVRPEPECDEGTDADDGGRMEIGVVATPAGAPEFQLAYGDLWARGYAEADGFVVTAGSEIRTLVNPSVNPILHKRRAELETAGVLAEIPGLSERKRLLAAVWFPSRDRGQGRQRSSRVWQQVGTRSRPAAARAGGLRENP